jgi:cyclohexyl-isocyanide hydratase
MTAAPAPIPAATPFPVVFALYPQVTQLDFTGPAEVFSRLPGARLTLASVTGGLLETESGITFAGVRPLAEVNECALLCVPGGYGTTTAMEDAAYLSALRRLAAQAPLRHLRLYGVPVAGRCRPAARQTRGVSLGMA